jgi:hypothetical protein
LNFFIFVTQYTTVSEDGELLVWDGPAIVASNRNQASLLLQAFYPDLNLVIVGQVVSNIEL